MSNFLVGRNLADPSYDVFSGTGAQTAFTLTTQSSTAAATVTISGVTQRPGTDFTISGTTLTFTAAPASGTNNVLIQYNKAYVVGTPGDATVTTAKLDDDAVTLAKMAAGTAGNLITYDASGNPAAVATGTAGQVLTSGGAGVAPTMQDAAGAIVQVVSGGTSAVITTTTIMPNDDTIPQNTEGGEVMTLAITPTSATNKLLIEAVTYMTKDTSDQAGVTALFQDTTAGALAAAGTTPSTANNMTTCYITHYMTAGTTSATTFKLRGGSANAGTVTWNGQSGGRYFGGVSATRMTITEIKA
jgi:hypothetical protein